MSLIVASKLCRERYEKTLICGGNSLSMTDTEKVRGYIDGETKVDDDETKVVDHETKIVDDETKVVDDEIEFKVTGWGYRHQQSLILFFCFTIAYSMRTCMGMALVGMVDRNYNKDIDNSTIIATGNISQFNIDNSSTVVGEDEEFKTRGILNALMLVPPYPKFKWNKKVQDAIQASFFWGYMVTQIPAGQLAHKFGAKYLLVGAMFTNCLVSILLPYGAYYGGWILIAIFRVLQGLSQACIVPSLHTFFGKWAPVEERAKLTSICYGGHALGTVLGMPITGFISASAMGWPGIFRFYGILSGIAGSLIWWLTADSPAQHSKISAAERKYIEVGLGQKYKGERKVMRVPWSKILRHRGMYAIIAAHVGSTWCQLTLFSEVPAFMDKVMGVNIQANGLLSALPFLVMWICNFFFSWLADYLVAKKLLSVTNTRKLSTSLGNIPPAIGFITLAYVPKNIYAVETILVIICAFKISSNTGFQVNHIDISPNFAGTMMSISNFVSNCFGSLAPMVAGFVLTDVTSEYEWRKVFLVSAGFYLISNLIYVSLGTAEVAEWNDPPEEGVSKEKEKEAFLTKIVSK